MMWWFLIPLILIILLICPIYLYIYYDGEFRLAVRILFVKFNIPLGKKKKDNKKKEKKKEEKPKKKPRKTETDGKSFLSQLGFFKDLVVSACNHILKALRIRRFKTEITVGSDDPCTTAMLYGSINALIYTLVSAVNALIAVDKRDIVISADYNAEKTFVLIDVVMRTFLFKLLIGLILFAIDGTIKLKEKKES